MPSLQEKELGEWWEYQQQWAGAEMGPLFPRGTDGQGNQKQPRGAVKSQRDDGCATRDLQGKRTAFAMGG